SPQMLSTSSRNFPAGFVVTARIIWGALLMGQFLAASVLLTQVHPTQPLDRQATLIILLVAGTLLVVGTVLSIIVPWLLIKPGADEPIRGRQCMSAMIIPMAMLEGASMVGLLAMAL